MQMVIGGKCIDSSDGKTGNVVNPATGKVIDTIPLATQNDIKHATDLAMLTMHKMLHDVGVPAGITQCITIARLTADRGLKGFGVTYHEVGDETTKDLIKKH